MKLQKRSMRQLPSSSAWRLSDEQAWAVLIQSC